MQPIALAYPREDAKIKQGRYGSMMPVTPANGFTLICRTKPGSGDAIRAYGVRLEAALKSTPDALAVLQLHYLRWILFDDDSRFTYTRIFATAFDKYVEDAVILFKSLGINRVLDY